MLFYLCPWLPGQPGQGRLSKPGQGRLAQPGLAVTGEEQGQAQGQAGHIQGRHGPGEE